MVNDQDCVPGYLVYQTSALLYANVETDSAGLEPAATCLYQLSYEPGRLAFFGRSSKRQRLTFS